MDAQFWHDKWESREIGFHQSDYNPFMLRHWAQLGLSANSRVFVPLCGKSRDMHWLLLQGYEVIGCELNETAVVELFDELALSPEIVREGVLTRYRADNLTVYVGDVFKLTLALLGPVDGIYDRAALVALPDSMRQDYARHLTSICANAPQLLITFVYEQAAHAGPPFSVSEDWVQQQYQANYAIQVLETAVLEGGLKGRVPATEQVFLLRPR
ncbi:thiopurine S-methyltransferase [Aestuariibacter halophilus]|uniref:Thiopurine S-methyltransferase n=1 Tax=Fluctibacter halophilus TaxID=226011 RepID=A0ABS8G737_9ALTE|nr:thiopurine S-methyltransferase [Aestuariibacter halophilus]MCC2616333.1 thiopurine S-methyltransferase [Aestuariibacter halophilus]